MTIRGQFVQDAESPLDKYEKDTPWGTVLAQKFKSGLGILQTNLLQLGKLVAEGQSETEKFVNKTFFPKMEENLIKLEEAYGKNPDANWVLEGLEGLIDSSVKMQQTASAAGEAKDPLKKFIGTGVEAIPPIGGAMFMSSAIAPMSKLAQAKIGGAKVAEFWNSVRKMLPFGSMSAAQTTQQLETTDPELPYVKKIFAGVLTGAGEMATELPVYIGVTKLLKAPGKVLVNKGAKAIAKSPKALAWLKNAVLQVGQEVEMEPISMSVLQAIGIKQDLKTLPANMVQAAYDGSAMVVTLAGLGGMSSRAQKLVLDNIIEKKPNLGEAVKVIQEVSKTLPQKTEPLTPKPIQLYREQTQASKEEVIRLEERLKTAPKSMQEGLLYDISLEKQRAETYDQKIIDKESTPKAEQIAPKKIETGKAYAVDVYRGVKESAPVDDGLFGSGTYFTTNEKYAEGYGTVEKSEVKLANPFVINNQEEADAFWNEYTRPIRKKAIAEGKTPQEANKLAAEETRKKLEEKGFDGLIARDIIEKGDEIVVFHPEKSQKKLKAEPIAPDTISDEATEATFSGEDIDDTDFSSQPLENILDLIDTGQEFDEQATSEYEFPEDVKSEGEGVESVGTPQWEANIGQLQEQEGAGATATRGAALSIEEKAIANKIIEGYDNLPTYEKVTAENQIKKGTRILQDPARAERIAMGEEACPADTLPEIVMGLVERKAIQEGNDELIYKLAHESKLLAEETTMGQRIWALSLRDIFSPVKTIKKLLKIQQDEYDKRKGDYVKDKKVEIEAVKKSIDKKKGTPDKVTEAINRGEINPEELASKPSQERRKILEPLVGEKKAKEIDADFENGTFLKNQKEGMKDWAEGIKDKKAKKDVMDKINDMNKLLNQKSLEKFLEDLISRRLGVGVTKDQANQIIKLSKTAQDAKKVMENSPRRGHLEKPTTTEMNYGRARVLFRNFTNNLREHAQKLTLAERFKPYNWWDNIKAIAGIAKSAKSTFDNSGLLRQNLKTFWTNPSLWFKNANQSWVDIAKVLGGNKQIMDEVDADIFSRPNFDKYIKDDLAINVTEEEFPYSDVLEKIPVLGRIHKAAETAFTGLAKRNRADFYDYYANIAEKQGQTPQGLGKMVNSLTGRGHLGAFEGSADAINVMFFSMRFFKSNVDFLTAHAFDSKVDKWTKKQAAKSLLKTVIGTAAILAMAKAMIPDSVEEDRTSANYGKIKVGNTRFDVTGGMGSLITLASRLIPVAWGEGQMKSSTTGIITKLNADTFNARTGMDLFYNFFENKLSPAAGFVRDLGQGRNFQGEKPTPLTQLRDLFVPIIIQEYNELKSDNNSADILLALIAEGVGIGINTYSAEVDWDYKQGKILKQFKEKVGDTKYRKANEEFNKEWLSWFDEIVKHPKYRAMSEEDKQKTITSKKAEIKAKLFRKYRFKYKQGE